MSGIGPVILEINHAEVTGAKWNMSFEQVLGGQGRAQVAIIDLGLTMDYEPHMDVKATLRRGGVVQFRGEIVNEPLEFVTGSGHRVWVLDCADYSGEFPQRLVGAFDGKTWQDVDGLGDYVNIDPNGHSLATDKLTIQALFDKYIRVDGQAIGTSTFVGEFLSNFTTIYWSYSDLQAALEEMASRIAANLQFWLDPDLEFHWAVIPAWQDLASGYVGLSASPSTSLTAAMFPELATTSTGVPIRSDVLGSSAGGVGLRNLKVTLDGSQMPQQLYVRGSTGYVYNAGSIDPTGGSVIINPEGYGSKATEKFRLTFTSSTKVWHTLANGLISGTYDTASAGGPYDVTFVSIPYNPANGKGGHFWKLLTGPDTGKYVDNDTNYFGYGAITVVKLVPTTTPASIGVGGSGWVNDVTQDLTLRQAYLEAPVSSDQATRDSIGNQVLYRASRPTLRGSCTVSGGYDGGGNFLGPDDWRVGQLVQVADPRMPTGLSGRYFVIQRVAAKLIEGSDAREYDLDFGDGPVSRYSYQAFGGTDNGDFPPPVVQIDIQAFDLTPGPNSKQTIVGQLVAKDGTPWEIADKVVKWTLEVYNSAGGAVTGQGSVAPEISGTDSHGRARTVLTTGATSGLVYFVFAEVAAV